MDNYSVISDTGVRLHFPNRKLHISFKQMHILILYQKIANAFEFEFIEFIDKVKCPLSSNGDYNIYVSPKQMTTAIKIYEKAYIHYKNSNICLTCIILN